MKTINQITKTTIYFLFALMVSLSSSCSPEDGKDGAQGEQGTAGQDGNANVTTYTFDVSTEDSAFNIPFPELTQSVLDNDVVLTYIKRTDTGIGNTYFPIPGISISYMIEVELSLEKMTFYFYNRNTGSSTTFNAGIFESVKTIIIESTGTASREVRSKNIYSELENAGIDVNNYYAVCDYLGIDY